MEEEICQYDKFGFCKFRKECKRRHFNEECKDLDKCSSIKTCRKRHPKHCKRYDSGQCRYKEDCTYKHQEPIKNMEQAQMVEKLKKLETVVHALTRKVLSLEEEMIKIKKNKKVIEVDEEEDIEFQNVSNNHPFKHTSSPIIKAKDSGVKVKENKDKPKKSEIKVQLPCTKCEYKTMKEATLEKHMTTKHSEH